MFHVCLCYALVVTCLERADLLVLLCVVFSCVFVTFTYVSRSTSELGVMLVPFNMFKPSSGFLLTVPVRYLFCGAFLIFMFHVCLLLYCLFSSMQPCDHLLGMG